MWRAEQERNLSLSNLQSCIIKSPRSDFCPGCSGLELSVKPKGIFAPTCVGVNYLLPNITCKGSNEKASWQSGGQWLPSPQNRRKYLTNGSLELGGASQTLSRGGGVWLFPTAGPCVLWDTLLTYLLLVLASGWDYSASWSPVPCFNGVFEHGLEIGYWGEFWSLALQIQLVNWCRQSCLLNFCSPHHIPASLLSHWLPDPPSAKLACTFVTCGHSSGSEGLFPHHTETFPNWKRALKGPRSLFQLFAWVSVSGSCTELQQLHDQTELEII